jgi:hypothetical protein
MDAKIDGFDVSSLKLLCEFLLKDTTISPETLFFWTYPSSNVQLMHSVVEAELWKHNASGIYCPN